MMLVLVLLLVLLNLAVSSVSGGLQFNAAPGSESIGGFVVQSSEVGKSERPILQLKSGQRIEGVLEAAGRVAVFKGLRFAAPPVGDFRFTPTQAYKPSEEEVSDLYDASQFGNECMQANGGHEDCLFLNVYVGADVLQNYNNNNSTNTNIPVPVGHFIHGGSYVNGNGSQYESAALVNYWDGKGIMVTSNYRLNLFGFLGGVEMTINDAKDGSTGNYGIQDQRMAMIWVKENIGAFGGDSSNVLIFGESAGAGSMSCHLAMKKSWGLFSKVILESGAFSQWVMQPMSVAQSKYDIVKSTVGCANLDCLMKMDAQVLFDKTSAITFPESFGYGDYAPVVDGVEISTHPFISVANGDIADVPILHGSNTDEGTMFTPPTITKSASIDGVKKMWESVGFDADRLEAIYITGKEYPTEESGATAAYYAAERSVGDWMFGCPAKYTADTVSKHYNAGALKNAKTFFYHFEHITNGKSFVAHASELIYVFHMDYLMNGVQKDEKMADVMSTYWGNFLLSNDPNVEKVGMSLFPKFPVWELYSEDNIYVQAQKQNANGGVLGLTKFKTEECNYFIPFIARMIEADFPQQ